MKVKLLSLAVAGALAAQANAGTVTSDGADIIVKTKSGFEVKTADKKASFRVGGRIQWDYNNAELNGDVDESDFHIRRARIYTKGHYGDWAYKAQFNIDQNVDDNKGGTVEDLYIQYKGFGKGAKIKVGRYKMPVGLEELTSSKDISILERSAITEMYALGRQEGISLDGSNGMFRYTLAAYEDGDGPSKREARSLGWAGRIVATPVKEKDSLVHLALSYTDRGNGDSIDDQYGVELATVQGPFHAQAEYYDADQVVGDSLDGYYVQLGWILTGESRPYKDGKFKIVKPSGKGGAWEVVARYEDGDGSWGDIELGDTEASAYTIGVNYYANSNVRIGATFSDGEDDLTDDEGEEFRMRLQYVY